MYYMEEIMNSSLEGYDWRLAQGGIARNMLDLRSQEAQAREGAPRCIQILGQMDYSTNHLARGINLFKEVRYAMLLFC